MVHIPAFGRLRQEDCCEFKASLGNRMRSCFSKQNIVCRQPPLTLASELVADASRDHWEAAGDRAASWMDHSSLSM